MSQATLMETYGLTQEEALEYEKELKKYYLACLWMEGSKLILFFMIFGYWGLMKELLMALLILMLLRNHGGGIHCKHYISCFAVSFAVLLSGILIPKYVTLPVSLMVLLLFVCALLGYRLVPIVSESRPKPSHQQVIHSKRVTFLIIFVYSLIVCICPANLYLNIGVWTVYIHIVQLLIARIIRKEG